MCCQCVCWRNERLAVSNQFNRCLCRETIFNRQLGDFRLQVFQSLVDLLFQAWLGLRHGHCHLTRHALATHRQNLPAAVELFEVVKTCAGTPHQSQINFTVIQRFKQLLMGTESVPCVAFAGGQQNLRWRAKHNTHALAFKVGQTFECLTSRCHDGVAEVEESIAFINTFDAVLRICRQCEISVAAIHGVAQSATLVERQPPHIFHCGAKSLANHFSKVYIQTPVSTLRFTKGQIVRVRTHTQRFSGSGKGGGGCRQEQSCRREKKACTVKAKLEHQKTPQN